MHAPKLVSPALGQWRVLYKDSQSRFLTNILFLCCWSAILIELFFHSSPIFLGLGMLQNTGLSVVADKLNFVRYLSHFRCVHRGAAFAKMRTTTVRRLLPESWGFLCPVHTPDGEPCGLMNHMTVICEIVSQSTNNSPLLVLLCTLGTVPASSPYAHAV